jgi:hypothetical protein
MKIFKIILFNCLCVVTVNALAQTDKATTLKIITEKTFVFVAKTAMPLNATEINAVMRQMPGNIGGANIDLSGNTYDIQITKDSITTFLPYYGRAFNAPINATDNGFKFTSKKFIYSNVKRKKGGWNITITPTDVKDGIRMNLSVSENGYATLSVNSNSKQSIAYSGYLSEIKK